jgi:hypothetical protein
MEDRRGKMEGVQRERYLFSIGAGIFDMIDMREGKWLASWNQLLVAVSIASRISFFSIPASKKFKLFPYANSATKSASNQEQNSAQNYQWNRFGEFQEKQVFLKDDSGKAGINTYNIRSQTPYRGQDIHILHDLDFLE